MFVQFLLQACAALEQKELMEELSESVAASSATYW